MKLVLLQPALARLQICDEICNFSRYSLVTHYFPPAKCNPAQFNFKGIVWL